MKINPVKTLSLDSLSAFQSEAQNKVLFFNQFGGSSCEANDTSSANDNSATNDTSLTQDSSGTYDSSIDTDISQMTDHY